LIKSVPIVREKAIQKFEIVPGKFNGKKPVFFVKEQGIGNREQEIN